MPLADHFERTEERVRRPWGSRAIAKPAGRSQDRGRRRIHARARGNAALSTADCTRGLISTTSLWSLRVDAAPDERREKLAGVPWTGFF